MTARDSRPTLHYCAGRCCPGLSWRADAAVPHPTSCLGPRKQLEEVSALWTPRLVTSEEVRP